ncbi:hypothetical protein [Paraburkholderia sp. J76]|uniref:aromatic-ring hydroxylase C-terminal domain-containing protein n=1 Tax=Paraburkholderia sp. J76 TaxID=2805439 RepID=UPI0039F60825
MTGRSVPDFELVDGTRVGNWLRDGRGLPLDFDSGASLRALASRWRKRLNYVATDAKERQGVRAVLVRPDGFVAWACEDVPDDQEFAIAPSRWFGDPEGAGEPRGAIASCREGILVCVLLHSPCGLGRIVALRVIIDTATIPFSRRTSCPKRLAILLDPPIPLCSRDALLAAWATAPCS